MKRDYRITDKGHVCWLDGRWTVFGWGRTTGEYAQLKKANKKEIKEFEYKEKKRKLEREARVSRESELLALCGLSHDDFSRFRGVAREGDKLIVDTRENGTNTRSVGAIRNLNYESSHADDGDSTYEW